MSEGNKDWYCDLRSALGAIRFFGRVTNKSWKKTKPGQYIYWINHDFFTQDPKIDIALHLGDGTEYHFIPTPEQKHDSHWIVYYSK